MTSQQQYFDGENIQFDKLFVVCARTVVGLVVPGHLALACFLRVKPCDVKMGVPVLLNTPGVFGR